MAQDMRVGTTLAGYRIEGLLGRGGMGVVYLAEDQRLGRRVALKVLAPELAVDERFRDRFIRESRIAASLEHPNIVPVYEAAEANGSLFIAMRHIRGTDLKTLIEEHGALDPARALPLLRQIASALDAAHEEGLVHRDVKPGNILVADAGSAPGSADVAYLSDFGLTKQTSSDSGLTATGQFMGTLDYAAPEQFAGQQVDGRADVYSLTGVLYECLSGEVPFPRGKDVALMFAHMSAKPPKLTDKRPDVAKTTDDVIAVGMAKSPEDRFETAGALISTARAVFEDGELAEEEAADWRMRRRRLRRKRRRGIIATVAAVIVISVTATAVAVTRPSPKTGPVHVPRVPAGLVRIDPAVGKVVGAPIQLPGRGGPVAAGGGFAWVTDTAGKKLLQVDPSTRAVKNSLSLAEQPIALAVGGSPPRIWVALSSQAWGVTPATDFAEATISIAGGFPLDIAPDTNDVWVITRATLTKGPNTGATTGRLARLDPATRIQSGTLTVGPGCCVATANGSVWVLGPDASGDPAPVLSKVDPASLKVTQTFELPKTLTGTPVALAFGEGFLWVAEDDGSVVRVDASTGKSVGVPTTTQPGTIAIAVGQGAAWVLSFLKGTVTRIDAATGRADPPIRVGSRPGGIAVGEGSVWVTLEGS